MKRALFVVALLSLSPLSHAAAPARPAEVFAEVVAAPPSTELPRVEQALVAAGVIGAGPTLDQVMPSLGKVVGLTSLPGLDAKRPIAVVVTDPRRSKTPSLLVAEVADEAKLAAALKGHDELLARRAKRVVVLGTKENVGLAGDYALSRYKGAPTDGVHARIFVRPVWAAFGAFAPMAKSMLVAQGNAAQQGKAAPVDLAKAFDVFITGVQQSNELAIDLSGKSGAFELVFELSVMPGTPIDGFVSAQRPSEFALLEKLAAQPATTIAGGRIDFSKIGDSVGDWLYGTADLKARDELVALLPLLNGEFAMAGSIASQAKSDFQYLMRTPEAARVLAAFPKVLDAMSKGSLMANTKMVRKAKPSFTYDGLTVQQSDVSTEWARDPSRPEAARVTQTSASTAWDDLVASASGGDAAEHLRKLVDAARHGTATLALSAAVRAGVERARTLKESLWMRVDLNELKAQPGTPQRPFVPSLGFGFGEHSARLRVVLGDVSARR